MQIAAEATIFESLLASAYSVRSGLFRRSVVAGRKSIHLNKLFLQTVSSGLRPAAFNARAEVPGRVSASVMGRLERGLDCQILQSGCLEDSAGSASGVEAHVGRTKVWTMSVLGLPCGNRKCG